MNSYLTTSTVLPVPVDRVFRDGISAADYLSFIEQNSKTVLQGNLIMIAVGVLYLHSAAGFLADKAELKTKAEAKAALTKAFGESDNPHSNARRSKRYKFAKLCTEIAMHKEVQPLVREAAKSSSVETAAAYLAAEFARCAKSVADLARHFGAGRTPGGEMREQEPARRPFLLLLRALVDKAEKGQQRIPFIDSVKVLAPAATQQDMVELLKQLIPHTADHALPELIELLIRVAEHRRANA